MQIICNFNTKPFNDIVLQIICNFNVKLFNDIAKINVQSLTNLIVRRYVAIFLTSLIF